MSQTQTQTQVLTNGDAKSQFLSHLTSYPVVSDGIEQFKANPLGAKSIEIVDATYTRVGKPLEPHLRTPYSYAKPYVNKADSLADQALNSVDNRFPIVKEDTNTIFDTVKGLVFWPFKVAGNGKDYVLNTWSDEYNKTAKRNARRSGPVTFGLAVVSTELRIASDALQYLAESLSDRGSEAKQKKDDLVSAAKQKKDTYAQKVQQDP
ncbi:hypothetical protein K461DRAFT_290304 [Myriangium duriaei CBS 260.36]|uniref:Uncharacterized protein n=1 Tax=Myriangium duriaei CBS 260.36 TaxID=1168546 RepID=A0A9P4JA12_9PEZI|nr:hypothetical protein K461DRAFT_290304 [Myriangium duriaei CBS 260.36]